MTKHLVQQSEWKRKNIFSFFIKMLDPNISITTEVDVTNCYKASTQKSFFIYYSYAILRAINEIQEFKMRIIKSVNTEVFLYDQIDLLTPIKINTSGDFVEVNIKYNVDFETFYTAAHLNIMDTSNKPAIAPQYANKDLAYVNISATPNLFFTAVKHSLIEAGGVNQVPLISIGKMIKRENRLIMPIAITVNHALVDGHHIGILVEKIQQYLNEFE